MRLDIFPSIPFPYFDEFSSCLWTESSTRRSQHGACRRVGIFSYFSSQYYSFPIINCSHHLCSWGCCISDLCSAYHEIFAFFFHFQKQPQKYQLFTPKFLNLKFCVAKCYPTSVIEVPRSFHLPVVQYSSESALPSKFMSGKTM